MSSRIKSLLGVGGGFFVFVGTRTLISGGNRETAILLLVPGIIFLGILGLVWIRE